MIFIIRDAEPARAPRPNFKRVVTYMCELLGFTLSKKKDISELLQAFYAHSVRHPHGWGLMFEDGSRNVLHEAICANESTILPYIIHSLPPQQHALAHIRFATVGSVKIENCHPFSQKDHSGREWTLIHNGTIFNGRHTQRYSAVQAGNTDSERFFLALMDAVNEQISRGVPTERARFDMISRFIIANAPRNKLNLMIYDGDLLYVHKNLKNTLCFKRLPEGLVFATAPLDDTGWNPFPMTQVIAYRDGKEVYRGDRHKGEFTPTLEYITAMDAMYI